VTERTPAAGQASVAVADAAPPPTPPLSPASAAPLGLTVLQYEPQRIANLAELEIDRPKPFGFPTPAQSALLVRLGRRAAGGVGPKGDVVAFSDICTHMGCPLGGTYSAGHKVLGPCVCHFTTFDLRQRGVVVVGQATDDLPQVELRFDASTGDLFATGLMGLVYGHRSNLDALVAAGSGS
jgi:arsenite oxidase small subunit